jgi:hypothetical protein
MALQILTGAGTHVPTAIVGCTGQIYLLSAVRDRTLYWWGSLPASRTVYSIRKSICPVAINSRNFLFILSRPGIILFVYRLMIYWNSVVEPTSFIF